MIKRTLIVIASALAIVFIPYYLGMVETHKTLSTVPIYLRGCIYICVISLLLAISHRIYWYIRDGN